MAGDNLIEESSIVEGRVDKMKKAVHKKSLRVSTRVRTNFRTFEHSIFPNGRLNWNDTLFDFQ
jgi:hypothetical protein